MPMCGNPQADFRHGLESKELKPENQSALIHDMPVCLSDCRGLRVPSGAALLALAVSAGAECATVDAAPPNVVLIVADDMGFSDAGCYGSEIRTPNLDRLAAGGLRFTNFYNTARCWPSRGALLTGYYPQQIGMDPAKGGVPEWVRLLPERLRTAGYRSYHSGKWHLRGIRGVVTRGGFDRSYHLEDCNRKFSPSEHYLDDQRLGAAGEDYYAATAVADHAVACLKDHARDHAGKPFFSYVAFTEPHFPLQAHEEDIRPYARTYLEGWDAIRKARWERLTAAGMVNCPLPPLDSSVVAPGFRDAMRETPGPGELERALPWDELTGEQRSFQSAKMAIHAAMVSRMDAEIGRILDTLQATGAWENTIVIFLSDNGASAELLVRGDGHDRAARPGSAASYLCLGPGWSSASNSPLRLHKIWVNEGGISTPFIVHWPAGIRAAGGVVHDPAHLVDVAPTLLELAGLSAHDPGGGAPPPAGVSLADTWKSGRPLPERPIYFSHERNHALRMGKFKIVSPGTDPVGWQLYDMDTDRSETTDLAAENPETVKRLAAVSKAMDQQFRADARGPGSPTSGKQDGGQIPTRD